MKTIKLLGTALLTIASYAVINAQCTASGTVTLTGNPGEISITDNSTSSGGGTYSYITFFNNTTSQNAGYVNLQPTTTSATYTFTDNGTYTYYLEAGDSLTNCYDSIGGTFVITGLSGGTTCGADFTLYQDSINQGLYYAWNTSTGNGLSYSWDFGDGSTSSTAYPTHTYASVGNYLICLTVSDGNGCSDTYCDTINVVVKAAGTSLQVLAPGQVVGVQELKAFNEVSVYPNPTSGTFRLSIDAAENINATVCITNLMGQVVDQVVISTFVGANEIVFNEENLLSGIYLVNLIEEGTGKVTTMKLIKE
jgi:PKD repeat protein